MSPIKGLLPSLREKKRYLVLEVVSDSQINDFKAVSDAIWGGALKYLGEFGVAEAGIVILGEKWNPKLQRTVIRVNNKHVDKLKMALSLIRNIDKQNVIIKSVGVSGILKKACDKFMTSKS
ncbi:hypothetical protein HN419_06415 [Candidatus Woesearchaeota archaeon]|nr:hypothetical protein [Candidatus Woesearchaeota archaeon]MBT3538128.1 hypothetical protein [Candidatus Woesearchaeota archaeon]MBT7105797.1 hypothetical protein [Candidatus Woesearchaeota archaeon]MBT7930634.1 hypothetical protein [Candidatus Woesearchaeota archaeon]